MVCTGFCIYIPVEKYPNIKVGDVVVIDKTTAFSEYTNYQNAYKVFGENYDDIDLYGEVTNIRERDSDNDYYIQGRLLNFAANYISPILFGYGRPYTAEGMLKYTERPSSFFSVVSEPIVARMRENYIHWWI